MELELFKTMSFARLNNELVEYCKQGNLIAVKELLTSKELKYHADIHFDDDKPFRMACMCGKSSIVKYLASSQELKKNANISALDDDPFIWAALGNHLEICKFLIFDMNLSKSPTIEEFMKNYPIEAIDKMWVIRDVNQKIKKELLFDMRKEMVFRL